MNKEELVSRLIKGTIQRAVQESSAALLVIILFGYALRYVPTGSARYYGCLLILIASGFITGVVWSFALSHRLLRTHPVGDSNFWHAAFLAQVRLLRLVPLWYLGPICTGVLLFTTPMEPGNFGVFLAQVVFVSLVFAGVTWLNRWVALKLEIDAQAFAS